ncbi:TB2/DP1, HVA22 family-domain-containing protein [Syncephalis fuscata]|nr:TB2/DP1, HVA22 family-domain-containing protein [Syncephalis fuscata]
MSLLYTVVKSLGVSVSIYRSFKALKHRQAADRRGWLQFWLTVVCLQQAEGFADWLCFWLPFYDELKALAVLWLIISGTWGATVLYHTSVRPFIAVHEKFVDYYVTGASIICVYVK